MSLFVVYNMTTTEVKAVYDNTSEELLDMFEKFCDFFRNTNFRNDGQGNQVTTRQKNIYSRAPKSGQTTVWISDVQNRPKTGRKSLDFRLSDIRMHLDFGALL